MGTSFATTIAAIATAKGQGGIGIVRVSGPNAYEIGAALLKKRLPPRIATFGKFFSASQDAIDIGVAIFFAAPHSFTGEDVVEFHGHGGILVLDQVLQRVLELGAILARPGEFSERAFLNHKIDLVQAEAIADLIAARSNEAVKAAARSLSGEFSTIINDLTDKLIHVRMYLEAAIDFPDEEVPLLQEGKVLDDLHFLHTNLQQLLQQAQLGNLLNSGIQVVLLGAPNVGKSSLLNALVGEDAAIVTEIPGTTRDLIRATFILDGFQVTILDTAGIRETYDPIELEGVARAKRALQHADIILLMQDSFKNITSFETLLTLVPLNAKIILVKNKIDLLQQPPCKQQLQHQNQTFLEVSLSAKTKAGIELLKQAIVATLGLSKQDPNAVFVARRRHLIAIETAFTHLEAAIIAHENHIGEFVAEELKLAQQALATITGSFSTDDLLTKIFSEFCLGK